MPGGAAWHTQRHITTRRDTLARHVHAHTPTTNLFTPPRLWHFSNEALIVYDGLYCVIRRMLAAFFRPKFYTIAVSFTTTARRRRNFFKKNMTNRFIEPLRSLFEYLILILYKRAQGWPIRWTIASSSRSHILRAISHLISISVHCRRWLICLFACSGEPSIENKKRSIKSNRWVHVRICKSEIMIDNLTWNMDRRPKGYKPWLLSLFMGASLKLYKISSVNILRR